MLECCLVNYSIHAMQTTESGVIATILYNMTVMIWIIWSVSLSSSSHEVLKLFFFLFSFFAWKPSLEALSKLRQTHLFQIGFEEV